MGVPYVVLIALGVAMLIGVLVARTTFGRYVVAMAAIPRRAASRGFPSAEPCSRCTS